MTSSAGAYEVSAEQQIMFELMEEDFLRVCRLEAPESRGTKRLATHVRDCFTQLLHPLCQPMRRSLNLYL